MGCAGLCAQASTHQSHLSVPSVLPSNFSLKAVINLSVLCRDGTVYGCGSTEYGQLPYLKFTAGAAGTEPALPNAVDQDGEPSHHTRNEVTVPTKLNLQFLQQQRGNKSAVVSSMMAGSFCSALLTRAPDELPDQRPTRLADRCACMLDLPVLLCALSGGVVKCISSVVSEVVYCL